MKVLELFSGTESFSNVAEYEGWNVFTVDIDKKFNPSLVKDVLLVKRGDIPFIPDVVWSSPPCEQYSHAKRSGIRDIEGANKNVLKTLEVISWFPKCVWIIENPQTGLLKNQPFMKDLPFVDVSYCKYGLPYRKQTRLWTNLDFKGKTCKKDCKFMVNGKHIGSAGNARKRYTDKHYSKRDKYKVPLKLCLDIINSIKKKMSENANKKGQKRVTNDADNVFQ